MRPGESKGRAGAVFAWRIVLRGIVPIALALKSFDENSRHVLAVDGHRTIADAMNGCSLRSRLERDHLPVRLRRAAAHPPYDDGFHAVDVDIDHEPFGVHLAAAREGFGLYRSLDIGLVERDHCTASADHSNHHLGCNTSWLTREGRLPGASPALKLVDRAERGG